MIVYCSCGGIFKPVKKYVNDGFAVYYENNCMKCSNHITISEKDYNTYCREFKEEFPTKEKERIQFIDYEIDRFNKVLLELKEEKNTLLNNKDK